MSRAASFRVSGAAGAAVNRKQTIGFRFNGREYSGYAGDTLASALLANGVRIVGRSFKFHRPRGVFSCGLEEPNAFVQLGSGVATIPSARATLVELHEGLEAFVPSGWPGLNFDLGRSLDFMAPLWAAGFYNKTFIWPNWHTYEDLIRRVAGFGHAPSGPDPDRYEVRNAHCDTLTIRSDSVSLKHADETRVLHNTVAVGYYDSAVVTLLESVPLSEVRRGGPRERYWIVRAQSVVLDTGAIEQPLVFCNNDRPGIVLAGAAHQYLNRYAVAVGRRVVVATNNDSAYALARDLKHAGVDVLVVVDSRPEPPAVLLEEMRALSIPVLVGSIPVDTSGFGGLSGVSVGRLSRDGKKIESERRYSCDALAVSGGWNPTLHLYSQAGGKLEYDENTRALASRDKHPVVTLANGDSAKVGSVGIRISPAGNTQRQWVDLRHDVTVADIELALRENYSSIEHVKRYTTSGMAADQGKTSHLATIDVVARLRGVKCADIGRTTLRPPFVPVTLGAIAGRAVGDLFAPARLTPMYAWHVANGGVLEDFGAWKRPAVYLRRGESRHEGIMREARAVRTGAGLFDGSSLGKIEVRGPDAVEFLDRFYINNLKTLKPGRVRYGIMLRESGIVFDDGTVVILAPDHLAITTSSGNASRVHAWLEEWHQCEWPHLRVAITQVTEQWAVVSLAGPKARDILSTLDTDIDLSNAAFPHLGMREGRLLGHPVRIYRVSFSGELTYEINVPAPMGQKLWDALLEAGRPYGIQPFGLEALMLMRLEKGFLHVGADTDGTTVPDDVGFGKVAAGKQADFVGKRSLLLPEHVRPDRLQLVGLTGDTTIVVGSHLRIEGSKEATDGWVTSAGRMALTGEPVALALLRGGRQQFGAHVSVHDFGKVTRAKVVEPPFYDRSGDRMNA